MARFKSVRCPREISRSGLVTPGALTLPITSHALSNVVLARGTIRVSPDYDVLAWLCERWLRQSAEEGWMYPTLYEIASDLYPNKSQPPSGKHYRLLREAICTLSLVGIQLFDYDAATGKQQMRATYNGHLMESNLNEFLHGVDPLKVRLAEWLRNELDRGAVVRLDWKILRAFDENQKLAKRLWIYLQAENWKRYGDRSMEGTWITFGDRLQSALGMGYKTNPRQARVAIKRACKTIRAIDDRYLAGSVELVKLGQGWRIQAKRPTAEQWRELEPEFEKTQTSREAARQHL